ncbi:MAG: type II secretion system F family protein [Candidatus Deferrimicrobiaceae bacterium]
MTLIPLLVFLLVLFVVIGGYLILGYENEQKDVDRRLSRLEVRDTLAESLPAILKSQVMSDVPLLNQILSNLNFAVRVDKRLQQAGLALKVGTFVLLSCTLFAFGTAVCLLLNWPLVFALGFGLALGILPNAVVNFRRRLRIKKFTVHFPDALEMFARSLRAGHSFSGAIELVAEEMPEPVGPEFRKIFDEQNLGIPLRQALLGMTERIDSLDVKFLVTAIMIHRDTGGNLAEIIDKISHVIRERFRIQGQLKTFTAQARLTGVILALLPVAAALLIGFLNPQYMRPLWEEPVGKYMIASAVILQVLGVMIIRKIVRIKI